MKTTKRTNEIDLSSTLELTPVEIKSLPRTEHLVPVGNEYCRLIKRLRSLSYKEQAIVEQLVDHLYEYKKINKSLGNR